MKKAPEIARLDTFFVWVVDCTGTGTSFLLCDKDNKLHKVILIAAFSYLLQYGIPVRQRHEIGSLQKRFKECGNLAKQTSKQAPEKSH